VLLQRSSNGLAAWKPVPFGLFIRLLDLTQSHWHFSRQ
jgi:hypothetical protein